jgi:hypothetical protein
VPLFNGIRDPLTLLNEGPTFRVEVFVSLSAELSIIAAGGTPPPPAVGFALVDTGASTSAVHEGIPASLGLRPVGIAPVVTPTTGATAVTKPLFAIRLVTPTDIPFDAIAIEADLGPQGIVALLGRDVLTDAIFVYNGTTGIYTIAK